MGNMNRITIIFLLMISIKSLNLETIDKNKMHNFKEFLLSLDINFAEDELPYRYWIYQKNHKKIEKLKIGINGDRDEYQHLLRNVNKNPEKLENYLKKRLSMQMKRLKHEKKMKNLP